VKETGLFPVFEAEHGDVVGVSKIRRRVPVEEYLKLQRRYAHLFGESGHPEMIERIQAIADRNIERFGLLPDDAQEVDLPGDATDMAGRTREEEARPEDTEHETNAMRLLEETHNWGSQ